MSSQNSIENQYLSVKLDQKTLAVSVVHKATGSTWSMFEGSDLDVLLDEGQSSLVQHAFSEFQDNFECWNRDDALLVRIPDAGLSISILLDDENVTFEIAPEHNTDIKPRDILYPRHFELAVEKGNYTVFPLNQGAIIPADWPAKFHHPEGYSEQRMHFHGAYDAKNDCGFIALTPTPDDLYIAVWNERPEDSANTFFHWLPSMGSLRYKRVVRYEFRKGLNYVEQGLRYRDWAKEHGFYASLQDKIKFNPNIQKFIGGPVIDAESMIRRTRNLEIRITPFDETATRIEKLKAITGIEDAVVHLDGWGKFGYDSLHPETLPASPDCGGNAGLKKLSERVKALGYLFALHDQYIDCYWDAPSFTEDNFRIQENGQPIKVNNWAGGMAYHNCYVSSLKFLKRNVFEGVRDQYMYHNSPSVMDICAPTAYYLDCFTRTVECYHEEHPLTRTENRAMQKKVLHTMRSGNDGQTHPVCVQIEELRDFAIPEVDFCYSIGHFTADVQLTDGTNESKLIGIGVPLWNLAFHDCVVQHNYGSPMNAMLYGEGCWLRVRGDDWESQLHTELETKRQILALHKEVGAEPMTNHEFIDLSKGVEKTTFANGISVTAHRVDNKVVIEGSQHCDGTIELGMESPLINVFDG